MHERIFFCFSHLHISVLFFFFLPLLLWVLCLLCFIKDISFRDFADSPVVRTPRFHCREHEFSPWSGKLKVPACPIN